MSKPTDYGKSSCVLCCSTEWIFDTFDTALDLQSYKSVIILCHPEIRSQIISSHPNLIFKLLFHDFINLNPKEEFNKYSIESIDLVTDNEFRALEINIYSTLYPLLRNIYIFDHGCKNSQDLRLIEYFTSRRLIKNIVLSLRLNIYKFLLLKQKRIYFHSRKPVLPLSRFHITGYLALKHDLTSFPRNTSIENKPIEPRGLILTNGSERYSYKEFSNTTLSLIQKIISSRLSQNPKYIFDVKCKPRELIDNRTFPLSHFSSESICICHPDTTLKAILKENLYDTIYTSVDSISFCVLHILGYNVVAYMPKTPFKLRLTSWYNNALCSISNDLKTPLLVPVSNDKLLLQFNISPNMLHQLLITK